MEATRSICEGRSWGARALVSIRFQEPANTSNPGTVVPQCPTPPLGYHLQTDSRCPDSRNFVPAGSFDRGSAQRFPAEWRWAVAQETLWECLQVRSGVFSVGDALWVSEGGPAMQPNWLYLMLKRLEARAGILNL